MIRFTSSVFGALLLAVSTLTAQTQLVRGDIDSISGTQLFRLECTQNVRLVSSTVNLQALENASSQQDIEYEMQVVDVSTPGQTTLDVVSATAIPEQLDMGNLRFGQSESWEVFGAPNSPVWVFLGFRLDTGYLPLGAPGTWVLGSSARLFNMGQTNGFGRFQFNFTMPSVPALVGFELTSQAVIAEPTGFVITHPDCKEIEAS